MKNKSKIISLFSISCVAIFSTIIATKTFRESLILHSRGDADSNYTITLDNSNKYDGVASKSISTDSGNYSVQFSYTNSSISQNGHVVLSTNGTLKNDQQITSITSIYSNFSCNSDVSLKFRASFNGTKWGEYAELTNKSYFDLPSNPYFIEFKADGGSVEIQSIKFTYSCVANENAKGDEKEPVFKKVTSSLNDYSGTYLAVYEGGNKAFNGSLSSLDAEGNYVSVSINTSKEIAYSDTLLASALTIAKTDDSYSVKTSQNKYIGQTNYSNGLSSNSSVLKNTLSISNSSLILKGEGGSTFSFNTATSGGNRFRYYKTPSTTIPAASLFKLEGGSNIGTPSYETGLTITDEKQNSYTIKESFDSFVENGGLNVSVMMSDGTTKKLSKNDYSYNVLFNNAVVSSSSFDEIGEYKVVINYKSLVPAEYKITVLDVVTGINAAKTKTSYDNGDAIDLSDVTATLNYFTGSVQNSISFANFGTNGIATELKNPNNVTVTSGTFNVSGSWTLKVYLVADHSVYTSITLNVADVPVSSISLNKTSLEVSIGSTATLTATILPANATNKTINWSTSDSSVATVNNGVITGVSVGNATITAEVGDYSATCLVAVKAISVTGVSLAPSSATIEVGSTATLTATISPSNASNKEVSWSSSENSVATVNANGVVSAVSVGSATITVSTVDGNKTSTCEITVKEKSEEQISSGTIEIVSTDLPTAYSASGTFTVTGSDEKSYTFNASNLANFGNGIQFKASSGYLSNKNSLTIKSIQLVGNDSAFSGTLYWGTEENPSTNEVSVTKDATYANPANYKYFKILKNSSGAGYLGKIIINLGANAPVNPTGLSLPATANLSVGSETSLDVTWSPSDANQNLGISWNSSNSSVATVDSNGTIKGISVGTATVTATSIFNSSFVSSCNVTVSEEQIDKWTILIYMCGSDLESGWDSDSNKYTDTSYYASSDLSEIKSVSGQPDDVNIVIEAGGAKRWSSTYSSVISSSKLNRFHLSNKNYVLDEQISNANMGSSSTLSSFISWGINNYPAEKTALILWNHGGAMRGVCYDENYDYDSLTNSEVKSALSSSLGSTKLEWIGYDACLMAVQDVAEFNSAYANYMVCAEESEAGAGWDYDTWVDDVYAKKTTETILNSICDGFISDTNKTYQENNWGTSDQTLSWLNLSYMSAYKTAFEAFASSLKTKLTNSSIKKADFKSWVVKNVKYYGGTDYDYFHTFDAKDFITKVKNNSTYNPGNDVCSSALTAFNNLVGYNKTGSGAGNSYGLALVYGCSSDYALGSTYYGTSQTNFTNWRSFNSSFGYI